jgi:hypothetical protein
MPSKIVKIEWDKPDDVNWLNRFNIELVLSAYCTHTNFRVTDVVELSDLEQWLCEKMGEAGRK